MSTPLAPPRDWFNAWLRRTGEQPPDFAALPPMADLPPLLTLADGRPVATPQDWEQRRQELRSLLEHYFWGRLPAQPPPLEQAQVLSEQPHAGATLRHVALTFATSPPVRITLELLLPPGPGPFPLFLTQTSHRPWAAIAVSRGYLACVYPAADHDDQSALFVPAYPDCDWATLPRRAWLAGRALDYLLTLPVHPDQVAITGHSRNGKQALIAAALDPRLRAVIASSAGSGGTCPFRFASEREYLESVEFITWLFPDWFHPRLRFFTGREHLLPVDAHAYLALIAPRPCLISTATHDGCESTFAVERSYLAARRVYRFLGRPQALRLRWRPGGHDAALEDVQSYLDWCDLAFGRGQARFPERLLHHFDWPRWRRRAAPLPPAPAADPLAAVHWMLGDPPPSYPPWGCHAGGEPRPQAALLGRAGAPSGISRLGFHLSEGVAADLYYPEHAAGPLPTVLWLHPFSRPLGYRGSYVAEHDTYRPYHIVEELARRGYACLAFDQLGFGARLEEGARFYHRYPAWSRLGKMVHDVRAALDLLSGQLPVSPGQPAPRLDPARLCCLGYSLGGMVALYAAALDPRVAALAPFCGLHPLRADPDSAPTGGIRRWWEWYGLLPRLGLFSGREAELPYDLEDLLALVAPRPCLLVTPRYDRDADPAAVTACVQRARARWPEGALTHLSPPDYNRFQPPQFALLFAWLARVLPVT